MNIIFYLLRIELNRFSGYDFRLVTQRFWVQIQIPGKERFFPLMFDCLLVLISITGEGLEMYMQKHAVVL
jgi:hypothetical protein